MSRVLVLGERDVRSALSPQGCERAMAAALSDRARGEAFNPLRSVMRAPGAAGLMGLMPAYGGDFALKAICIMPGNPARGLDAHQGIVTLFDGETGAPTAILDASAITEIRTAAVTALATRRLARGDADILAVLGAGVQGRAHLRALADVRSWREVRLYAPTVEHARALADEGSSDVVVAESAREAVEGAGVVVCATSSRRPVLERGWLASGAHVNAIGASTPDAQEIDVETVAAAALYCDSRESVLAEAGEFRLAVEQGVISGVQHIRAELGEVLIDAAPAPSGDEELTVFRSLGIGVEDLAAAREAVSVARERGLGVDVEL